MGGEISLHIGGLWHWAYDILNQSYQGGKLACFTARTTRQALGCIVIPSKHPSIRSLWHSIRQITNICYPFMSGGSLILTLSTIYWVIITIFLSFISSSSSIILPHLWLTIVYSPRGKDSPPSPRFAVDKNLLHHTPGSIPQGQRATVARGEVLPDQQTLGRCREGCPNWGPLGKLVWN